VDVRLSIDATGKTEAHVTADQPETLNLLQKDSGTSPRRCAIPGWMCRRAASISRCAARTARAATTMRPGARFAFQPDGQPRSGRGADGFQHFLHRRRGPDAPGYSRLKVKNHEHSQPHHLDHSRNQQQHQRQRHGSSCRAISTPSCSFHHPVAEPGSHQPDGHQSVHPAAGRIQPGGTADRPTPI